MTRSVSCWSESSVWPAKRPSHEGVGIVSGSAVSACATCWTTAGDAARCWHAGRRLGMVRRITRSAVEQPDGGARGGQRLAAESGPAAQAKA